MPWLFEKIKVPDEYQQAGAAERYPHAFRVSLSMPAGPQPWCRKCQRGATRWVWDHYADGFWGIAAFCHGQVCGGLLPLHARPPDVRVEVFCENEPRLPEFPLWFVASSGDELQASRDYIDAAVRSGREHPFQSGALAQWSKRNAALVMGTCIGVPSVPIWIRLIRRLFSHG